MKLKHRAQAVWSVAIAISAILLGATFALRLVSRILARRDQAFTSGALCPNIGEVIGVGFLVVGLVILKVWMDRRSELERDILNAFLEYVPENVYFKDRQSRFIRINRAMAAYFGLEDPHQAINKTDADIFSSEHAGQALKDEEEIILSGRPIYGVEEKETWPDGHESWVLTTKVPFKNNRGHIIGTMGISHNITEHKQAEERIHYMALHDALTGLPNRTLLMDRLSQTITLARRNGNRVAVLMFDLDRFKTVNDSFGHFVGDRLLEAVSVRLKSCLRESDIVARLGGDEFAIVLPEIHGDQDIKTVVEKVLTAIAKPMQLENQELQTSASIGICQYPNDGEYAEALLQIADAAMYEAKKNGRGTYAFFTPELTQAARRRQKLEMGLRQACARGGFALHYQPLVATDSGQITAVEALLRWRHPELGTISPSEFVPLLEEIGLMTEVGCWVLKTACLQNVAWHKKGLPPLRVAVNVSAQQFYRGNIVNAVTTALREAEMDPQWLELELTESLTLDDSETSVTIMNELKQIGVGLSLDDFGTGWSSLSYLRRFPLDRIKIDRSFLRDIESESAAEAVVRSILNLGRNLGLSCIAEGVETHEQLAYLQNHMCAEMQGFLYSPALPADDCEMLIRAQNSQAFPISTGTAPAHRGPRQRSVFRKATGTIVSHVDLK